MKKTGFVLGLTGIFLSSLPLFLWAYTPDAIYNRSVPLMDYVPQEIGMGEYLYTSLEANDCRLCHGDSLAERHHYSDLALVSWCSPCHHSSPIWPYVTIETDCTVSGCHSSADLGPLNVAGTPPNGFHHYTEFSYSDRCTACHDSDLIDHIAEDEAVPFSMYPPSVLPPSPFSCENCHWEQPVIANTTSTGWHNTDPQTNNPYSLGEMANAGHPSTFDHNHPAAPYSTEGATPGPWNDYFEYDRKIESNFDTHHMLVTTGNVHADCERCHSVAPDDPSWNPGDPELIRYCETCHDMATLHAIAPHVGPGGTVDPVAVRGWEAVGFHLPDLSNTDTTDVAPGTYRGFSANEQCYGCHGDQLPTWLPDAPDDVPTITEMTPQVSACDGYVTLDGAHFGDQETQDRSVQIKRTRGRSWWTVPVSSWTDTEIAFRMPCWTFPMGNYYVTVETEIGKSNVAVLTLTSNGSVHAISPAAGKCREIITVNGIGFGDAQDTIDEVFGIYRTVQFVSPSTTYTVDAVGAWSNTSFKVRFGDLFEDNDGDFLRDPNEPLVRQCENMAPGDYAAYVTAIYYEDTDSSGDYSEGDPVYRQTAGDPQDFTLQQGLALYVIQPGNVERSHYCPDGTLINGVVKIYGWGFGATQGNGAVYIGTGPMYTSGTGLALKRLVWTDNVIKAGMDVPPGAKGMTLYLWVEKDGQKTDASYGWPGIHIRSSETCP